MTSADLRRRVDDWVAGDPDPVTRAEVRALGEEELAERFSGSLRFGTAGIRGPVRAGPTGMNVAVVVRTTAGLARYLEAAGHAGGEVIVGRDARHGSATFAEATAEALRAAGFRVTTFAEPVPTPVVAFAVRSRGAVAGVQITASHNPANDNGYKVFGIGGAQIVPPSDRDIEAAVAQVGPAVSVPRSPVDPSGTDIVPAYLDRVAGLARGANRGIRIALTALHGVGGAVAVEALRRAGFHDVHVVDAQFAPDPDFPTVSFPNPEELGATDMLLALAERVDATVAVALDPDADRCAVGIRRGGQWRMLTGDETGSVLAEHFLRSAPEGALVANTLVSSTLLGALARARGARYARTLTGFKWLARAGEGLVYAYEEAIGHCVDPDAVRDKDGISAAVVLCDAAATLSAAGRTFDDVLDDLHIELGVHLGAQVSRRLGRIADIDEAMRAVRDAPPTHLAGVPVTAIDHRARTDALRTDAVELTGGGVRVVIRPSGTEPKLKVYLESVDAVDGPEDLARARAAAAECLAVLGEFARGL